MSRKPTIQTTKAEASAKVSAEPPTGAGHNGDGGAAANGKPPLPAPPDLRQPEGEPPTDLTGKYPADQPVTQLDATDMRSLFRAAYDWLAHNYEHVNRLNVFPVPDGDTGTNMLLTIKSAWNNVVHRSDAKTVSEVAEAAAEGAHHGSRGNSGVILGQILRGFSQALRGKQEITSADLAQALKEASEAAYDAVPSPVEGTILTVSREISTAAGEAAETTTDVREVLAQVVEGADKAVERTPDQLPALKKAGVVDSGGKGLFFFFEGMYRALTGQPVHHDGEAAAGEAAAGEADEAAEERARHKGRRDLPPLQWGFDVQYLIEKPSKPVHVIAADIAAMGECPLVEGDEHLVKVHVHVFDPGVPLTYGVNTGFITDVVVENMDDMAAAGRAAGGIDGAIAVGEPPIVPLHLEEGQIGLVAVTPGAGFADIFRNLGAHGIVDGGQSMNPSVADLAEAVRKLPTERVVLLPNNRNVLMAAQQTAKLLAKEHPPRQIVVVPSKNLPQGIAALTVFDPLALDLDRLKEEMNAQMDYVQAGEVTQAVRTAEVDGVSVRQGDFIGLHNGKLVSRGSGVQETALDLLRKMGAEEGSLTTLYYGSFVGKAAAEDFAETVRGEYPDHDVELAYGGQPHYHFILSVE